MQESKCRRCGRCCYEKLYIGGIVFNTDIPCKYLDPATKLCTIYPDRHRINPRCLDVPTGIAWGVFPADCPYVAGLPNYRPPFELPLDSELMRRVRIGEITDPEELIRLLRRKARGKKRSNVAQ